MSISSKITVYEKILKWSQLRCRPMWQRDALRRIVTKGKLDAADLEELVELCKQGEGKKSTHLPQPIESVHIPTNPGQIADVSLVSISNVDGVNNLAPGQTLSFGQSGLTVIYGDNGSGKSGYARILKRACRARQPGGIAPNVFAADQQAGPASATIIYSLGGAQQPPEQWQNTEHPHAVLPAISVFDSTCVSVHIGKKNEVAFRPFGLDIPEQLADVCQAVREALTSEKELLEKARNPIFSKPTWSETTLAGRAIAGLKHDINLKSLVTLGTLTENESLRLGHLKEDLLKDPKKAAAEQTLKADNLNRLLSALKEIAEKTSDHALTAIYSQDRTARRKRAAARLAAEKDFSGDPLEGGGGEIWRSLWEAARRYSTQFAYPDLPFPPAKTEMHCLLCQQPLQAEALERMSRFEKFIQTDTEKQAQRSDAEIKAAIGGLVSHNIGSRAYSAYIQELAVQNQPLARNVRRFLASARLRRYALIKGLGTEPMATSPVGEVNPSADIWHLEGTVRNYALDLKNSAATDDRKKIETEFAELSDRALLKSMMQTIQEEVNRLREIQFLEKCVGQTATAPITILGNQIADSVVTPKLKARFQSEIVRLAAEKVHVEIVRSGGKYGAPEYQVRLSANHGAKVGVVLSEGEQSCIALAAFLTELATAAHGSALIFDDPVSSLDHKWRKQVAVRLVEEAEHRQVVVFTHDLIFVTDLEDLAQRQERQFQLTMVSRGQSGAGVVSKNLPWKGKRLVNRIDKLEESARKARSHYDNDEMEAYIPAATAIYNSLRNTWELALEVIAFSSVVVGHRDYIDATNLLKVTVLTESDCEIFRSSFKKCCDISDTHIGSRSPSGGTPPPDEMLEDIKTLKLWSKSLSDRQQAIVASRLTQSAGGGEGIVIP